MLFAKALEGPPRDHSACVEQWTFHGTCEVPTGNMRDGRAGRSGGTWEAGVVKNAVCVSGVVRFAAYI